MAFIIRCDKCGTRHHHDEDHVCPGKSPPVVPAVTPGSVPPEKSQPEKLVHIPDGVFTEDEVSRLRELLEPTEDRSKRLAGERQKRWREKNREKYNSYMRAYRKRKDE